MSADEMIESFAYEMQVHGVAVFEAVVPPERCAAMKQDVLDLYEQTLRRYQIDAGLGEIAQWSAHHICGRRDAVHDFLEADYLRDHIARYFDGKPYILNTIGAAINPPAARSGSYEHGHKWHRDGRTFVGAGQRQLLVGLVLLDDSTAAHGTLQVLPGSHHVRDFPAADYVSRHRRILEAPRGSIILFDADIWHRVDDNRTDDFWVGVTYMLSRPYFKQQMDYPRFLSPEYAASLSPRLRQLYGFNARTPATYAEWYQPGDKRFYQSNQE